MIALNTIPSPSIYQDELTFLDLSDTPAIVLSIIFLFIAYYRVKLAKKEPHPQGHIVDSNRAVNTEAYDTLNQLKKQYNDSLKPLLNFTPLITVGELVVTFVLIVFYYFLFTKAF